MKRLKIGILTFHFSENFGGLLQAYGLSKWLSSLGHDVEFINYHPLHIEDGGNFERLWDPRRVRANAKKAYLKLSNLQRKWLGDKSQHRAFEEFRAFQLGISGPPLRARADVEAALSQSASPHDLIVVGSDQIWASSLQHGLDQVYFADFQVPVTTQRISYAPSFGRASVDEVNVRELKLLISTES